jgi:hypothetical protein
VSEGVFSRVLSDEYRIVSYGVFSVCSEGAVLFHFHNDKAGVELVVSFKIVNTKVAAESQPAALVV